MNIHVLPGDAQVETFNAAGIEGEIAVCRECLVEGDVSGETLPEFWKNRAVFIGSAYDETLEGYLNNVTGEFEKIRSASAGDTVSLWSEYELFCSVNYWFCLSLLRGTVADVYRVSPIVRGESDKWKGLGQLTAEDFRSCFAARVQLTAEDIERGSALWNAYRINDADKLRALCTDDSGAFPMLVETVEAAIAKDARPQSIMRDIIAEGIQGFDRRFEEFSKRAGVYGYGDTQVRRIIETL